MKGRGSTIHMRGGWKKEAEEDSSCHTRET